jgi:peptide/nickel transport system ATP-binding protein
MLSALGLVNGGKISGEITFESRSLGLIDLLKASESQMQKIRGNEIAMIFQEPMTSLNPVYTCGDQVMEALIWHKKISKTEAKSQTLALFERVKLPSPPRIFDSYPHQLSGGQKQRVMIAMALSCGPSLLIADEPTTALDVTVQASILNTLHELRAELGLSIIFITHDLGVVADIADRVVVMYKGDLVEQGPCGEVFKAPQHAYTQALLACRPHVGVRVSRLPVVSDFLGTNADTETKKTTVSVVSLAEFQQRQILLSEKKPVLEVKNLKVHFPIRPNWLGKSKEVIKAVDDVSFVVYPDETLGLVGESGCGKSTLGRAILRLVEPTTGEIIFEDRALQSLTDKQMRLQRKDLQVIFQDPYSSLNPRMKVGDAILEPMQIHGILENDKARREKIGYLLETVSLSAHDIQKYPHEFSGGQRQRICIARALALSPKFLICDESVSALDVSVQAQVLNLINDLKKSFGFTCIFISHDLSVVRYMSDRVMVMNKGKIEELGDAESVYTHPTSTYTQELISAVPGKRLQRVF